MKLWRKEERDGWKGSEGSLVSTRLEVISTLIPKLWPMMSNWVNYCPNICPLQQETVACLVTVGTQGSLWSLRWEAQASCYSGSECPQLGGDFSSGLCGPAWPSLCFWSWPCCYISPHTKILKDFSYFWFMYYFSWSQLPASSWSEYFGWLLKVISRDVSSPPKSSSTPDYSQPGNATMYNSFPWTQGNA